MCTASAPLTLESAGVICTRISLLRGRLLQGEREGGVGLDVSVCLRSVAVASVLTVMTARHAKDFVAESASAPPASSAVTPLKYGAKYMSSVSGAAALGTEHELFANDEGVAALLCPPLPPPLTPTCARQFLSCRKDLR